MTSQFDIDDCWNRSGIGANNQCEMLQEFVHCRNCPQYHEAARKIMHRPVSREYRQEWARHFARMEDARRVADKSAFVFRIGHEWLALATGALVTVAPRTDAHRLPHCHVPGLLGIVNVSGKLYPCISLADLMAIDVQQPYPQPAHHVFPRLVVARLGPHAVALPVDDVRGIARYGDDDLLAPPSTVSKGLARYLVGVLGLGEQQAGYLDADLLGKSIAKAIR